MEAQLRIAVDRLGDPVDHDAPGQEVFQAVEEADSMVTSTPESVLAECKSAHVR